MQYKKFKRIEEELSVLGLGTWQFAGKGDWPGFEKKDAINIIDKAIDAGINFIDTAPVYGLGHSETIVGEALQGKRNKVFLATKCGLPWDENNNVRNDLTKAGLEKEIDDSLRRLKTDHIDLYQVHWPDPNTPLSETMETLAAIQKQGKIRYIGVSNFSEDMMKESMEIAELVSHQGLYNMLEQDAKSYHNIPLQYRVKSSLLDFLEKNDQFFLPYSPLMQGLLAGKASFDAGAVSSNPQLQGEYLTKHLGTLKKIQELTDHPMHEVALNWLIAQKTIGPVIGGCTRVEHLQSNLKALEWTMNADLFNRINNLVAEA